MIFPIVEERNYKKRKSKKTRKRQAWKIRDGTVYCTLTSQQRDTIVSVLEVKEKVTVHPTRYDSNFKTRHSVSRRWEVISAQVFEYMTLPKHKLLLAVEIEVISLASEFVGYQVLWTNFPELREVLSNEVYPLQ